MSTSELRDLNENLTQHPYVSGYVPGSDDRRVFSEMFGGNINVAQWAARMASYYPSERARMYPKAVDTFGQQDGDKDE